MFSLSYYANLFLLALNEIDFPRVESDFPVTVIGK